MTRGWEVNCESDKSANRRAPLACNDVVLHLILIHCSPNCPEGFPSHSSPTWSSSWMICLKRPGKTSSFLLSFASVAVVACLKISQLYYHQVLRNFGIKYPTRANPITIVSRVVNWCFETYFCLCLNHWECLVSTILKSLYFVKIISRVRTFNPHLGALRAS